MTLNMLYAAADDGKMLPVIDVNNPAFQVAIAEQELSSMAKQFIHDQQHQQELSAAMLEALRNSTLGQAVMASAGTYLSGMATYLMKLGPGNLGADAGLIDQGIASSFPAFVARIRLQDMADLLAEGLARILAAQPNRAVSLLNIAGGPCADSWNALMILRKTQPALVAGRDVTIAALDTDDRGPAFGRRALARLLEPDAPLRGLQVDLEHIEYRWDDADKLSALLLQRHVKERACAISSEGGLFEYGTDGAIIANLSVLQAETAADAVVVGSVTRKCEVQEAMRRNNMATTRPRTLEEFDALACQAGWKLARVIERPFTYNVRLARK